MLSDDGDARTQRAFQKVLSTAWLWTRATPITLAGLRLNSKRERNLLDTFKVYTNGSNNEERLADVVETSLGAFVIATRVPELEAIIQKLLREGVTPEQVYHSLGASIRAFGGKCHGHKTPRNRSVQPPGDYSRWKVSFRFRYATPLWEHPLLKAEEEPSRKQTKARASPPVPVCTGEEQIN